MLRSVYIVILTSICASAFSQMQMLNSSRYTIQAEIDLVEEQFSILDRSEQTGPFLRNVDIKVEFGELIITYDLQRTKEDQYYAVELIASLNGEALRMHPSDILGDVGKRIERTNNQPKQIVWANLLDRYLNLSGDLTLELSVLLWGEPDLPYNLVCGEIPVFGGKQHMVHYITAGLGVAAIGASVFLFEDAENTYQENYLSQNFEASAEAPYQDANDKRHIALAVRYAGIGILAADVGVFVYRYLRHRKKLNAYEEFCGQKAVQVSPYYRPNLNFGKGEEVGFRFTVSF